jgi:hypothetical protein
MSAGRWLVAAGWVLFALMGIVVLMAAVTLGLLMALAPTDDGIGYMAIAAMIVALPIGLVGVVPFVAGKRMIERQRRVSGPGAS